MGFINLMRLNIRKRNSCASALVSLSDVQPPSVYKSHILSARVSFSDVQPPEVYKSHILSARVSFSDVQPPEVYKSHILNGPINKRTRFFIGCSTSLGL